MKWELGTKEIWQNQLSHESNLDVYSVFSRNGMGVSLHFYLYEVSKQQQQQEKKKKNGFERFI